MTVPWLRRCDCTWPTFLTVLCETHCVLLLPALCSPAVPFRMNSLHLVQTLKAPEVPPRPCQVGAWLRARDARTARTLPPPAWGTPPQPLASCPGLPPALHGSVVPLQHWLCQDSPRPQCQLQRARLGSETGSSPAQGATTAGCPRREGTEGSKGHGGAKGQRGTGWGVPPWLAGSIQPHMSSSKGDRPPECSPSVLGRHPDLPHQQPGNAQHFSPAQVPLSLQRRSQIPPPSASQN